MERRRLNGSVAWSIAVDNVTIVRGHSCSGVQLILSCRFSGSGSSWSLFARGILFGEALLDGFGFPIIIPDSPAVFDHATAELAKH